MEQELAAFRELAILAPGLIKKTKSRHRLKGLQPETAPDQPRVLSSTAEQRPVAAAAAAAAATASSSAIAAAVAADTVAAAVTSFEIILSFF